MPEQIDPIEALKRTTDICIAAHQDDIEILAYSAIAECFGKKDKWFSGVVVTDGAGSPRSGIYANYTDEMMQELRLQEQRKAASIGDYSIQIQLGYKSSEVKNPNFWDLRSDLIEVLNVAEAERIFLHNPADKHDTHVAVALRAISAIRQLPLKKRPKQVFGCEVWRSLDWLCDNEKIIFDASERKNLAAALLGVFDSQISGGKRYDLAVMGRRLANATFFASHSTDNADSLIFAMDLTPLIQDSTISIEEFTLNMIDRFKDDVKQRIRSLE
ncbi:MAG TPA: PIG-L family deacetylase [Victivallales bacterium]|nr:PIG-L family deacetylase [Victivallales bacterium]HRU02003.1 PIG-L family deacetylase [Victivallales bacterium]